MSDSPRWRQAFDAVEKRVTPPAEQFVRTSGFAVGVALAGRARALARGAARDLTVAEPRPFGLELDGYAHIPRMLDKVRRMRAVLDAAGSGADLEVDGGIKPDNVAQLITAGATVVVAGSAVYSPQRSVAEAVRLLREAVGARR